MTRVRVKAIEGQPDLATGQVTIDTTATQIVPAAPANERRSVLVVSHGGVDVFLGKSNVTTSGAGGGVLLTGTKGASITLETRGAIYGIVAAGTQLVSWQEDR